MPVPPNRSGVLDTTAWIQIKNIPAKTSGPYVIHVPKRVIPLSTRRSRLKRLIREAMRKSPRLAVGRQWAIGVRRRPPEKAKLADVITAIDTLLKGL